MTDPQRPLKVFLCHAHADRDAVRGLYHRLTKDGVDAWLDKEKLLPGQDWELEIRKAVRESDVVVVCLSKQFNQAGFRQKEVRLALDTAMEQPEGEIFIIPARLEECDTLESLRKWHWVDLFEENGYEMLIRAFRSRADKIGATLVRKSWLPKAMDTSRGEKKPVEKKQDKPAGQPEPAPRVTRQDTREETRRKPNITIIFVLIGIAVLISAAVLGAPLLRGLLRPQMTQTASSGNPTITSASTPAGGVLGPMLQAPVSPQPITDLAFSPDGTKLAAASQDHTIYLLNTENGKELLRLSDHADVVTSVDWSPDGLQLVSGSNDRTVRIWNTSTGKQVSIFEGHTNFVSSVAWSHDGGRIASAGTDSQVIIWNWNNGDITLQVDIGNLGNGIAWSPDDKLLAVSSIGQFFVLDAGTGVIIQNLSGDWGDVNRVAWSPDGRYLAAASHDNNVHIWQLSDWTEQVLQGHTDNVMDVAWFPDNNFLASVSYDGTVRVWDISKGQEIPIRLGNPSDALTLDLSSDGKLLAGAGDLGGQGYVEIWDITRLNLAKNSSLPETPTSTSRAVDGLSTEITDAKGVSMVLVPAGQFIMGSDSGEPDERPVQSIDLSEFYIDKYEVTNAYYETCVSAGECQPPTNAGSYSSSSYYGSLEFSNYPVIYVGWDMARIYCEWRDAELPTEAQWEKAARGTDGRIYSWGSLFDGSRLNFCDKNCDFGAVRDVTYDDGYKATSPVGSYAGGEGPYGTYDMAGNVWEWVMDWYSGTYYQTLFDGFLNPKGPDKDSGHFHVIRGGSWINNANRVRSTERGYFEEGDFIYIGFRCARDATP